LAHTAEHAIDLDTGAIVSVTVQGADEGDTIMIHETLPRYFYKTGGPMLTHFPPAVPEIPVRNIEEAAEYYVNVLGFRFDWGDDDGGIGGISQGDCRMFLTNALFRTSHGRKVR
jgi:hypothetical protein